MTHKTKTPGLVRLYHATTDEAAAAILASSFTESLHAKEKRTCAQNEPDLPLAQRSRAY